MQRFAISPFGGRGLVRAQFLVNEQVQQARAAMSHAQTPENTRQAAGQGASCAAAIDKWQLLRAVTQARPELALSDRTIVVLEALASFHPARILDPAEELVVFPSNTELSLRARGMAPATLRRHLAALVNAGLVLRRDSANGKRYARRDEDGRIEAAFGFDLAPLVVRAAEIQSLAAKIRKQAQALRALRSEITIHLRDIAALLRVIQEEGRAEAYTAYSDRLNALSGRLGRNTSWDLLKTRRDALVILRGDLETAYLEQLEDVKEPSSKHQEMSASDSQNERHIHNSESESFIEKESIKSAATNSTPDMHSASDDEDTASEMNENAGTDARNSLKTAQNFQKNAGKSSKPAMALELVAAACPQIRDYAPGGLQSWRDFHKAANTVQAMLGVSPIVWAQAQSKMGEIDAAIAVAAILERAESIRSPGGYLRRLTERADNGGFSVKPMLHALLTARQKRGAMGLTA